MDINKGQYSWAKEKVCLGVYAYFQVYRKWKKRSVI